MSILYWDQCCAAGHQTLHDVDVNELWHPRFAFMTQHDNTTRDIELRVGYTVSPRNTRLTNSHFGI